MTTRKEVIAAAKEVGAQTRIYEKSPGLDYYQFETAQLERFYAIAFEAGRQAEREECAKVCEDLGENIHGPGREDSEAYDCADGVCARSKK